MKLLCVVVVVVVAVATLENSADETIPGHKPSRLRLLANHIRSGDCRKQIFRLADALTKSAPWAVKTFEASAERPTGLIYGNDHRFGDYDACLAGKAPLRGKYCLVDVAFAPNEDKYPPFYFDSNEKEFALEYDPRKSFLEKFRVTRDPTKKRRNVFHTGVCVPESCSDAEVEEGVNGALAVVAREYDYTVIARIQDHSCSKNNPVRLSTGGMIVCSLILILLKLVLVATVWDAFRKDRKNGDEHSSTLEMVALSFSLKSNLKKLSSHGGRNCMDVFNTMKALSMMLIILGHRCVASFGGPIFNINFMEESYRWFPSIFLLNGIIIVDTFFFVGGFLTFRTLRREYEKGKDLNTAKVCFYRWLRIVPEYMLTVFFYGYVLEHLGSGPIWSVKVGREAERCRDNWWTNFLFVNNYINTNRLCMFQSWYVACDMHFLLISPLIVKWVSKLGKRGLALLIGCILAASIGVSVITYMNEYDGFMRVYYSEFEDLANSFFFSQVYVQSHNRIIPYLSGMTAAYVYIQLQESNIQLSKNVVYTFTVTAIVTGLASISVAWVFYIPGREYNAIENALYASLHRLFWSLSIGWITIANGGQGSGVIHSILSNKIFTPISKLTYGAYLIHGAVQLYTTATVRAPEYISFPNLFWMASGDLVLSFFFALLLYLIVEAPIQSFHKIFCMKKNSR